MSTIDTRSLRWLGVLVPLAFWSLALFFEQAVLGVPLAVSRLATELLLIAVGSTLFANWVANSLERQQAALRRNNEHLEALRAAALTLTTELEIDAVLQRVVDLSRQLVAARYGALAVLSADGQRIVRFFTSGLDEAGRRAMSNLPEGHGLLGLMLRDGATMRVEQIAADRRAAGFPPHHPQMQNLVGVPIIAKGKIIGNLYLADKTNHTVTPFTQEDEQILQMFATQAAIAIENAQLYAENQQLAVFQERDRIGMDLHDGVIQSIYAIGLLLDDARHRIDQEPDRVRAVIRTAIGGLNDVIKDIRNYIQDLRPQRFEGRNVRQGLEQLAKELRTDTMLRIDLTVEPEAAAACTARQADEFLHIAQEALANVRKHANATAVALEFGFYDGLLQMTIQDDGVGLDMAQARHAVGNGLRNMRERVRALNGQLRIDGAPGRGARIAVQAPIEKREA
jgi:signal transduction histidine kinase